MRIYHGRPREVPREPPGCPPWAHAKRHGTRVHGLLSANRLGASALMQGLADGYFILPYTIGDRARAVVHWGVDAWQRIGDVATRDTGLGIA